MLTPKNLKIINFDTYAANSDGKPVEGTKVFHTLLFNVTQISPEEVTMLIDNDTWWNDNRVIEVNDEQLRYLHDKES